MKRLLCIVGSMDAGGAETFLMKVFREMDKTKYAFDFCVSSSGVYDDEIKNMGGKIFYKPTKKHFLKSYACIKNLVKTNGYESVLRISQNSASVFDLIAAKKGGAKNLFFRSSNTKVFGSVFNKFVHFLFKPLLKRIATTKIAPSKESAIFMFGKSDYRNKKCFILHNAITYSDYMFDNHFRNSKREKDNCLFLGHIGRFNKQKNHDFLFKVYKQFVQVSKKDSKLLLFGTGDKEEVKRIKQKIDDYNLTNNVFLMGVEPKINKWYSVLDVLLFPSFFEGMPNVVIEAQASDLCCLISDTITNDVVITNKTKRLPITDSSIKLWVEELSKCSPSVARNNNEDLFTFAGYNLATYISTITDILFEEKKCL